MAVIDPSVAWEKDFAPANKKNTMQVKNGFGGGMNQIILTVMKLGIIWQVIMETRSLNLEVVKAAFAANKGDWLFRKIVNADARVTELIRFIYVYVDDEVFMLEWYVKHTDLNNDGTAFEVEDFLELHKQVWMTDSVPQWESQGRFKLRLAA